MADTVLFSAARQLLDKCGLVPDVRILRLMAQTRQLPADDDSLVPAVACKGGNAV